MFLSFIGIKTLKLMKGNMEKQYYYQKRAFSVYFILLCPKMTKSTHWILYGERERDLQKRLFPRGLSGPLLFSLILRDVCMLFHALRPSGSFGTLLWSTWCHMLALGDDFPPVSSPSSLGVDVCWHCSLPHTLCRMDAVPGNWFCTKKNTVDIWIYQTFH